MAKELKDFLKELDNLKEFDKDTLELKSKLIRESRIQAVLKKARINDRFVNKKCSKYRKIRRK